MSSLGPAWWTGATDYESGSELHERATSFVAQVHWDAVTSLASRLRSGVTCCLSTNYSLGHFNMVRQIQFEDNVLWIIRLRLPELKGVFGAREDLSVENSMQIEIATMNYVRANTSIPVPQVFDYDCHCNNEVGVPYIFMSYIEGNVASELRLTKQCEIGLFGTVDQDRRFRQQMARIQVQFASLQFDHIGSLYQEGDSFSIGPEVETGQGPWDSSDQYYEVLASHVLQVAKTDAPAEVQQRRSFQLPFMFTELMSIYGKTSASGRFGLANRDFGAHNLLVDDEFAIVGVIDFDGVMAAPIEMIAQFPILTGLDRTPPGHVETRPAAIERMAKVAPKLAEYRDLVREAEKSLNKGQQSPIADCMMSDATAILYGLNRYGGHQGFTNDNWMAAYEKLLQKA